MNLGEIAYVHNELAETCKNLKEFDFSAADCKMLDWLPHFLRRERSNGRVAMQTQLDLQLNLPMLQMAVGVREHLRSRPGGCFQATKWASKCISLLSVGVSS